VQHARKYVIDIDSSDEGSDIDAGGHVENSFYKFDNFGRPSTPEKRRRGSVNT
jgi:hypothetical protein